MASIRIVKAFPGAYDHIHTRPYKEGEVYEIGSEFMPEEFASVCLSEGYATSLTGMGVPQTPGKGVGTPPEQPPPRQGPKQTPKQTPKGKGG